MYQSHGARLPAMSRPLPGICPAVAHRAGNSGLCSSRDRDSCLCGVFQQVLWSCLPVVSPLLQDEHSTLLLSLSVQGSKAGACMRKVVQKVRS
jgi:hypothetical protein